MARTGVTENDVFEAADALVARGERPTIERLRSELGTGSPNTLLRHLDAWWKGLAARLDAHARAITLPEAPADVQAAATHLWTRALAIAQERARADMEAAYQRLETDRMALAERERRALADRTAALEQAAAAEARLADLHRLTDVQARQINDLQQQRDGAVADRDAIQRALEGQQQSAAERLAAVLREREAADHQYRTTEARWMRETDRARQESAALQRQLEREKSAHARERATLSEELKSLRNDLRASERQRGARDAEVVRLQRDLARAQASLAAKPRAPSTPRRPRGKAGTT
jgi:hypothetical protein